MTIDLDTTRTAIVDHPWRAIVLAMAGGAFVALVEPRSKLGRALASVVASTTLAAIRQVVARDLDRRVASWVVAPSHPD